jgi:hypothetical protein
MDLHDALMYFSGVVMFGCLLSMSLIILTFGLHHLQVTYQEIDPLPVAPVQSPRSTKRHAWGVENGTDPHALYMINPYRK